MLKILLNAGNSPIFGFAYVLLLILFYVKIAMTWRQSAGVRSLSTSEASQRLNAENLFYPYLVGLIEGDGYFSITKKGKYLTYELGIELSIRDVQLIYKIKKLLGVGIVSFRKRKKDSIEMVSLRIRNKNHLKNIIFPIFDKYPMFSNKQYNYLRFKECLLSNVLYSKDLKEYIRDNNTPLNTVESIINASYFSSWLIGFIEAEGCFSTYKTKDNYIIGSFDISQTNGDILILAIKTSLSITTGIYVDKTNNYKLKATSVRSIENTVKFLKNTPVKLLGYKRLQYLLWLKELRSIPRYSKYIPNKY